MDRIAELDAIVAQYDLNQHPFYQEWRMGTLPVEKLRRYAADYALFVGTIDEGWDRVGETHYAEEERVHERLWAQFQEAVGAPAAAAGPQVDTLVRASKNCFQLEPEAIGALYAFEAQQPSTSQSKLDGLREHYGMDGKATEYFEVHAGDVRERNLLRERAATLSNREFSRARSACGVVCAAMWSALDGVYDSV
jgi:pyrroloquinoline-quinone synthase